MTYPLIPGQEATLNTREAVEQHYEGGGFLVDSFVPCPHLMDPKTCGHCAHPRHEVSLNGIDTSITFANGEVILSRATPAGGYSFSIDHATAYWLSDHLPQLLRSVASVDDLPIPLVPADPWCGQPSPDCESGLTLCADLEQRERTRLADGGRA